MVSMVAMETENLFRLIIQYYLMLQMEGTEIYSTFKWEESKVN